MRRSGKLEGIDFFHHVRKFPIRWIVAAGYNSRRSQRALHRDACSKGRGSSAIVSFASDTRNSRTEQAVTVRIVSPAQHKVQLSWKASTSKHILGYNVYRGNHSSGPYKKINGDLDPYTRLTDRTVAAAHKYYYVATAVNLKKKESHYSKQIQVVIP